jgi:hypothetical protein
VPFIAFDIAHRHAVEAALRDWSRTLPRQPGQIGGPIISTVEAPQIGTTVRLMVDTGFVDFLKTRDIPFQKD